MARKVTIVFAALVLLIPLGVLAEMRMQDATELHHFQLPCDTCHEAQSGISALELASQTTAGRLKGDINKLCATGGCHNFDPMMSHPVGVAAPAGMPSDMPLDGGSRITCLTCHSKPNPANDLARSDLGAGRRLHRPRGIEFCGQCHMKMGGKLSKQSHWQFSVKAHLGSKGMAATAFNQDVDKFTQDIDVESRMCLGCHDNLDVTIPPYEETKQEKKARWKKMSSHPIGMDYRRMALASMGKLNFPAAETGRIRLFDGRMGCGTCHSLYAKTKNNLVERWKKGVLCKRCHNLP